jgi:streptogramin lyase
VTRIGLPVVTDSFLPDEAGFGGQLAIAEGAVWVVSDQIEMPTRLGGRVGRGVVRVDPRTARVTAVTPLDNLEPTWMALAVGAGGVWVGGPQAQRAGPAHGLMVDRIDPRSGRLAGTFALAGNTGGLLAAGHGSLWLATFGGGELLRLDPSRR